jgi:branched-chain amino acid transport system permease protein
MDVVEILLEAARTAVGPLGAAYALAAIGLNVQFGYTGLLNFGHIAFLMVGAYGTAITVDQGGSLWLGIAIGVAAAAVLGLVFGLPTLRLRVDYLAIVTIAGAEVLRILVRSGDEDSLTGGVFGIQRFADDFYDLNPYSPGTYGWGDDFVFSARGMWVLTVTWVLVALCTAFVVLLVRSPWGRVLKSIREDEDAARSLGKNVFSYKLQALVVGGVIASFAGIMLAIDRQSVNPDSYLPAGTFVAFAIVILGGAGSRFGPILGALFYWFVITFTDGLLRGAIDEGWISRDLIDTTDIGSVRFMLVGLGLMALMIFRPQGILGRREEVLLESR